MEMVRTILAVDDVPAVLEYLRALLAGHHHVLITTTEPEQASATELLERIRSLIPD